MAPFDGMVRSLVTPAPRFQTRPMVPPPSRRTETTEVVVTSAILLPCLQSTVMVAVEAEHPKLDGAIRPLEKVKVVGFLGHPVPEKKDS